MKPIVIFLEKNQDGKYSLTEEQVRDIIEKGYNAGFEDGQKSIPQYPYPVNIPDFTITSNVECSNEGSGFIER